MGARLAQQSRPADGEEARHGNEGAVAGISGLIEALVFTTSAILDVFVATLPEIVIQSLLFGYLIMYWERRGRQAPAG